MGHNFCRECGAGFPPREGEGHCKEWKECMIKQCVRNFSTKQVSNSSEPKSALNSEQSFD